MSGVDDRVVSMQFDNATFEQHLGDTLKSLDKLNESLKFNEAQQNLKGLSDAGNNFNMGKMGDAVQGVSSKFLALATVGITAISNITNKAVDAGLAMAKSFTVQPITDGLHEFETNMNSIQTILANTQSKGSNLGDVNNALQQLNTYSDKTIYNFTEMAKNIGTFTAAGVGLDTSVKSIKGIANLAAISGSSADQASTAMYQLSQAIASGSVKLMDWNSVVNAGMGGETFQKALFESGKAMKTLTDVPAGQTFDEWKKAGNSFRDSLQSGWLTTEVLTKTLNAFTGDLSVAQIQAMGYTKQQAEELFRVGQTGEKAATQVKTFSQLIDTVKEAIGSGWTQTFQILFGNFNEAIDLFTSINNVISKFVGDNANARNSLLQGWKDLGGRTALIEAFKDGFKALGAILKTVKDAFREIFPATTVLDLVMLTDRFKDFMQALMPAPKTLDELKRIFAGVFAVVDILREVFVQLFGVVKDIVGQFSGAGGGMLEFGAKTGDALVKLDNFLVKGKELTVFFAKIKLYINEAIDVLKNAFDAVASFFGKVTESSGPAEKAVDRVGQRFDAIGAIVDKLKALFEKVKPILDAAQTAISDWFKNLGKNLAEAIKPGDFNTALDALNVGLLGGIIVMLKRFFDNGFKLDIGGGVFSKIGQSLDSLTGTLKSMQTQLKSEAIEKIAISIGILTASVLVLSLIDSEALTKAMVALSVGFGELLGTMKLLDQISSGAGSAAKLGVLATALILLASAAVVLAGAVKIFSTMSLEELSKGLGGVAAGLAIMIGAVKALEGDTAGVLAASVALIAMSTGLLILSEAVKSFAQLSWEEMAKGLVGVGAGLGIIVLAMNAMPVASTLAAGVAMIPLATGLVILAQAVQSFATLSWGEMLKGMVGLAASLAIIAIAMENMPPTLPITAAGLILVGIALEIIGRVIGKLGALDFDTLAKGIGAIAAVLVVLAIGVNAMDGALSGAAALIVVSISLEALAKVIEKLGQMSLKELAIGIGAIAAVLVVLGLAALVMTPIIPALAALGVSLTLVGLGFALFGAGAWLVAKAFQALAEAGKAGTQALIDSIEAVIRALPRLITAFIDSLAQTAIELFKSGDMLLRIITVFLIQVLETVVKLAPEIAKAIAAILTEGLKLLRDHFPDLIETAFDMLMVFLKAVRDHIEDVATLGVEIVVKLATALAQNAQKLVDAAITLLLAFLDAIAKRATDIAGAGLNILLALIKGMGDNVQKIIDLAATLIVQFVQAILANVQYIVEAGVNILVAFVTGVARDIKKVGDKGADIVLSLAQGIADNIVRVSNKAADILISFLNAMADTIRTKTPELRAAGFNIASAIVEGISGGIFQKAGDVANSAIDLARKAVDAVKDFLHINSPSKKFIEIGESMAEGLVVALDKDTTAENSAVAAAERVLEAFRLSLNTIPDSLEGMDEFNPVITPVLDLTKVQAASRGLAGMMAVSPISPSVSFDQARTISSTAEANSTATGASSDNTPTELKFEQNIYSPTALSTSDIYRNTKSQIALAKEELGI